MYQELLASLPHLHDPFAKRRPPISLVQLRKRFNMLDPAHQSLMDELWETVLWSHIPLATPDTQLVLRFNQVLATIADEQLHQWLLWRMDVRTVLAALRRRHLGEEAPLPHEFWGVGNLTHLIRQRWRQPAFGLAAHFTWLPEIETLMAEGDSLALEERILAVLWQYLNLCQPQQADGFSAVFLYAMRWDISQRWTRYDSDTGLDNFRQLVAASLEPVQLWAAP